MMNFRRQLAATASALVRRFSTEVKQHDCLYRRLSKLGSIKGMVESTINEYIREGRIIGKSELDKCVKELRKYKRFDQALEVRWICVIFHMVCIFMVCRDCAILRYFCYLFSVKMNDLPFILSENDNGNLSNIDFILLLGLLKDVWSKNLYTVIFFGIEKQMQHSYSYTVGIYIL